MKIIRSETIIISKKESEALDLTDNILEGIIRETFDRELADKIQKAQAALSDVYECIADVEVEE